jgi:hypothetical protein
MQFGAQNGVSTAVAQRLLEVSLSTLTNPIYAIVEPVPRQSINQLPVRQCKLKVVQKRLVIL